MAENQNEDEKPDPDILVCMSRLRPDANQQVKRDFAKSFAESLDVANVAPGEGFYIVSAPIWEEMREQRDTAISERDEAQDTLEEAGRIAKAAEDAANATMDAVYEIVEDVKRGLVPLDIAEIEEELIRRAGSGTPRVP